MQAVSGYHRRMVRVYASTCAAILKVIDKFIESAIYLVIFIEIGNKIKGLTATDAAKDGPNDSITTQNGRQCFKIFPCTKRHWLIPVAYAYKHPESEISTSRLSCHVNGINIIGSKTACNCCSLKSLLHTANANALRGSY